MAEFLVSSEPLQYYYSVRLQFLQFQKFNFATSD